MTCKLSTGSSGVEETIPAAGSDWRTSKGHRALQYECEHLREGGHHIVQEPSKEALNRESAHGTALSVELAI